MIHTSLRKYSNLAIPLVTYVSLAILIMLSESGVSQTRKLEPPEFGSLNFADLHMKSCKFDTAADALILIDRAELQHLKSGSSHLKIHIRIKIFKKSAYEKWGNVKLTLPRREFSQLQGATYTLEEGVVRQTVLSSNNIFRKKRGKYFEDVTFTFPNLKEGAVIEYSYMLKMPGWPVIDWSFQNSIPTSWSGYTVKYLSWSYKENIRGTHPLNKEQTVHMEKFHRWVMTDVPAFKTEAYMPDPSLFKSAVQFWEAGMTWDFLLTKLYSSRSFGKVLYSDSLKQTAEKIIAGIGSKQEQIKAVSNYVKSNVKWDGTTDYRGDYSGLVLKRKTGTSGDINLLLANLLQQADFNVEMVLLSTRDHGVIFQQFPSMTQFDDVVCRVTVDGVTSLLDATEKYLPYNTLPPRCLNFNGLSMDTAKGTWIKIQANTKLKEMVAINGSISSDGTISGRITRSHDGYAAYYVRTMYNDADEEAYIKNFTKNISWQIEKKGLQNFDVTDKIPKEEYEVQIEDEVTTSGGIMYVNPFLILKEKDNPFAPETRNYAIDFIMPIEKTYVATIRIPADYEVEELPLSKVFILPNNDAKATFSFSRAGKLFFVSYNLQINKSLFYSDEYPALREFYSHLVSKMGEQVVLKKVN